MVETRTGVDAIDEIGAVPGVDAVYIGPNDLALGCGHGRGTYRDSAEVDALIQGVVDAGAPGWSPGCTARTSRWRCTGPAGGSGC
jgi:4-hydroxy-2-oxoheptanedioate aldolase